MTCRELIEFLVDYASGDLSPEERARFDAHLAICPACVNYLQNYRAVVELVQAAEAGEDGATPPHVPEELVQAILDSRRKLD